MFCLQTPPHLPDPGVGSISLNSTFSEHSHVAYQIKWNHKCSNLVANTVPADPPPWGQKGQNSTFSEHDHVAYQIKRGSQMQQPGSKYFACRPPPSSNLMESLMHHGSKYFQKSHQCKGKHIVHQLKKSISLFRLFFFLYSLHFVLPSMHLLHLAI